MLLRVYVDTPDEFNKWIANQQRTQPELNQNAQSAESEPNPGNAGVVQAAVTRTPPNSPVTRGNIAGVSGEEPQEISTRAGQFVFEHQSCISCHTVAGTVATGRYGPDLTHLMSRDTLAAGAAANNPKELLRWIGDPNQIKPGSMMPAMHLSDRENQQITAYLMTLK
jgi:cytochrome c oxidase subunit 2